ncbi:CHY_and RING-type zinc-finger domain-containing protein [Hexamita inflata]|uniref:CHY and RING-type zinc-finger domain-containing protein n=1 Tax=Hexamita inflata TaxID=28002 RepID=A0AA86NZS1_9EUKA|nr:CHY and RING-type zinc-finger domain-containing protein [Hexamita inflata]
MSDSEDYSGSNSDGNFEEQENIEQENNKQENKPELAPGQVRLIQANISDENNTTVRKIVICGENEYTDHLLKQKRRPIFPKQYFSETKTLQQMLDDFQVALGTGEIKYHWMHSSKPSQEYFVQYESITGNGCPHYVTSLAYECKICKKFFGCPYCHEESLGLNEPHPFEVSGQVQCLECSEVQDFHQQCVKCSCKMYQTACNKCGFSSKNIDFYHCDKCNICVEGLPAHFTHCDKCNQCIHKFMIDDHPAVCGNDLAQNCQICQGEFDLMFMKRHKLTCPHDTHLSCLQKLKQSSNNNACPSCRLPMQTATENAAERQKFISVYAMTEVPQYKLGNYVNVSCLKCKEQFVKHWHPKGYICPFCDSVNCSEGEKYADTESGAELVLEQYKMMREKRNVIPIYPLILFPKDKYEEMADMIEDYVQAYKPYWIEARKKMTTCPFEMPLRELVNAYCLVRDIDEQIGFAALNIVHARKFFPPVERLSELSIEVCKAMAEVKEVKRLNIQ